MCLESLFEEIAAEYRLPAGEAKAFVERTLSSALSESFGKRTVVLISGSDISIYHEKGGDGTPILEQLPLSRMNRKLLRHCRYRIGSELQKRKSQLEYDYLKQLQSALVRGTIWRVRDDGSLIVLFRVDELFNRREITGVCPLTRQPPRERRKFRTGDNRYFFVSKVLLIRLAGRDRLFRAEIILSRTSLRLPELLLRIKSECADIRCIRRIAGRISFVVSRKRLPWETIREVSAELGERVKVTWES